MAVRSQVAHTGARDGSDLPDIGCSAREVYDFTSRWGGHILNALLDGPHRFSELHRTVDGISEKMLSQTLRTQIRDGLVTRSVQPTTPPQVSYELTDLGRGLIESLQPFVEWVRRNAVEVAAARHRHDQNQK
ncbi:helix-turn-helix transcriptional regulator [Frankia sp. AgB1.9]|uniref:winged helix-turn-helix transcriptional regulator n=1 Tax=unclassified Frankia TaxID=2632575 RepID=UPI0019334E5E|nr:MULTISPECIES: helix-turn-helix domain-containing protein [unclassified Frankia]MBL7492934.1 helix-turn-helix transcriptional regulator [Frankia sp. AgW1.1]MBL7550538.1 helix-turn-helix transcriptional regulator [Frankia sp. AgB1.9]MBL7624946.1 helix-turn-helix transcriptional regulator [Frankia sp. AgB1.8]